MTTSLAKQLKKLQIPGQFSQSERQGTSKASFLLTGKDAGTLDLDSIYWLGLNGLEELISIDPSFNKYTDTLFSESSRDFERSILTQEAAKKVDESISGFLRLLSPYFLLRPAHKCLEWLVRVYEVHKCNIDGLMECVLPYYETNLFARLVQILRLGDDASFWSWLSPIQKEGTPLSRLSLVQHCLSDGSFLSFICNMVSSSLSQDEGPSCTNTHRVLISFYVSTVCGVLERGRVSEGLIGVLLPFIVNGLGSECGEYKCAMYMVSGLLTSKTQLSTKAINSLLESIINVRHNYILLLLLLLLLLHVHLVDPIAF